MLHDIRELIERRRNNRGQNDNNEDAPEDIQLDSSRDGQADQADAQIPSEPSVQPQDMINNNPALLLSNIIPAVSNNPRPRSVEADRSAAQVHIEEEKEEQHGEAPNSSRKLIEVNQIHLEIEGDKK